MFIDFEGISGSGKTALAERVAARLRQLGHRVMHAPPGELSARLSGAAAVHPRAWLFQALAREAQAREDHVRPALRRGELCITEDSLAGLWATAQAGLGMPASALSSAFGLAEARLQPDVVVLLDADPELARFRKIADGRTAPSIWSRGVEARARRELLAMAWRDPTRWIVVENEARAHALLEERIVSALLTRLGRGQPQVEPLLPAVSPPPFAKTPEALEDAFFGAVERIAALEPRVAVLLLAGIHGERAARLRQTASERHPRDVARSLAGVIDASALRLRELLLDLAPREVARSLQGARGPTVDALRHALFDRAPAEVVSTLEGDERAWAWNLRERALGLGFEEEVLRSLAGVDGARAWRVRNAGLSRGWLGPVAESLTGLPGRDAELLREKLFQEVPAAGVASTCGVASAHADHLRERAYERLPGVVLRSLAGGESPLAFALREKAAPTCPEAIESLAGLDSEAAWGLRERYVATWPDAAVGSLGALAGTRRGRAVLERALFHSGDRLGVLRRGCAAWKRRMVEASATAPDAAEPAVLAS